MDNKYKTEDAAKYLGVSLYYLRNMRHEMHEHSGPAFEYGPGSKGIACYYSKDELDRWKATHKFRVRKTTKKNDLDKKCHV